MSEEIEKAKGLNGESVGKIKMSESGYTGLKISNGQIYEELKQELQFPASIVTYKQMSYDSTISAALSYYESMMLKAKWRIVPVSNATAKEVKQAEFIEECFNDMEHSWQDFIQEVSSMNSYGFCVNEIVLRQRLKKSGSKYNDGKVGIRKLPVRSQDTLDKWIYSKNGRDLIGVRQNLNLVANMGRSFILPDGKSEITIPREQFLLFRTGKRKDNPYGESPLKNCYFAWKYKINIEEQEAIGINRDLSGIPHAEVPAQIMATDASPEQKAQMQMWENIVRNIHNNNQAGLVTPLIYDEVTKQPLYKFSLLKNEGGKAYDTSAIKQYYVNSILTALHCDLLIMGQSSTGSYALGSIKNTMAAVAVETKLREIANVINQHLIPLLADQNGWNLARLPQILFDDLEGDADPEGWSKLLQRAASVGLIEKDRAILNRVREMLGVDAYPSDKPVDESILTGNTSKSGNELGNPNEGSRTSSTDQNDNDLNLDNVG